MQTNFRNTVQKLVAESMTKNITKNVVSGGMKAAAGPAGFINAIGGKLSKQVLGYDFFGLITNIGVFYIVAFVIDAIFDAVILGGGAVAWIAKLLGKQLPPIFPQPIVDFYKQGFKGVFQYWDAVHITVIILISAEALRYIKNNEESGGTPSYFTLSIFAMMIGAVFLLVGPSLYQKLKEAGIVTGFLGPSGSGGITSGSSSSVTFTSVPPSPPGSGN